MAAIDELLVGMLDEQGSDLHLATDQVPRVRVDGELIPLDLPPLGEATVAALMREICPARLWERFAERHDLDFAYAIPEKGRFRCNYLNTTDGLAAVLRAIPTVVQTLEELHLPEVLRELCYGRRGLIVVTGPTGSGKSTTLAAMIDHINGRLARRIITIEDPVEFVHTPRKSVVIHREVGLHCRTFAEALRSAMRSDPDVVLLGEMRDSETIRLALDCAARGTLVFATLHTNSAPKTLDRIVDAFPADEQPQIRGLLAETLTAVVAQLLCRRADARGRVAAHEILVRTPSLPHVIREGPSGAVQSLIDSGGNLGMVSLDASLRRLHAEGRISAFEAYMKATAKEHFAATVAQDRPPQTAGASLAELDHRRYTTALFPDREDQDEAVVVPPPVPPPGAAHPAVPPPPPEP